MQLQQNLFSLYRLLLQLPKTLFILMTILMLSFTIIHVHYIYQTQDHLNQILNNANNTLNDCIIDYMKHKHQIIYRNKIRNDSGIYDSDNISLKSQGLNDTSIKNSLNSTNSSSNIQNSSQIYNRTESQNKSQIIDYYFLEELTLLHIKMGSTNQYTYQIDYHQYKERPIFLITDSKQFMNLINKDNAYLKKHNMTFDLIKIPQIVINPPTFTLYYNERMLINELLMQYLRDKIIYLQNDFMKYKIKNNITNIQFKFSQLQLIFYVQYDSTLATFYPYSINLMQFMTYKIIPVFFLKIYYSIGIFILLMVLSMLIGLMVRYIIILLMTVYLLIADKCLRQSWGWTHQYLIILYNRYRNNPISTMKILIFYVISNIGMYLFFIFGVYCIVKKLVYPTIALYLDQYKWFYIKTCFLIELFHFIFSRSRLTIKFYPLVSFLINYLILLICFLNVSGYTMIYLNINMFLHLAVFFMFMIVQKMILGDQKGLNDDYCPSFNKPRMLFYAGYDIGWQKSLPPLWTYFTKWFDYSYFNESQRCLIEKDYQLLYGRMLGLNQRQQIPEQDSQISQNPIMRQPSYQMNLIQD